MSEKIEEEKKVQLKYRNRIIELERQLEFEIKRANQYQNKYEESVLSEQFSAEHSFLSELKEKQESINQLRKENLQLNVKIHSGSSIKKVDDCFKQNQQLRDIIEELKAAAVSAIMEKDAEIQELRNQGTDMNLIMKLESAEDRIQTLEHENRHLASSYEKQIQQLYDKINEQRHSFSIKLENLHGDINHEEAVKKNLEEKATNLVGDLESLEKQIVRYEKRIIQLENQLSNQKISLAQVEHSLKIKTEEASQFQQQHQSLCKSYEKIEKNLFEKEKKIQHLKEQNEELDRKLIIRKRKNEKKENKNYQVLQSFDEFSRKADLASSFVMSPKKEGTGAALGVNESFIGTPVKLSDIEEITELENFDISGFTDHDITQPSLKNDSSKLNQEAQSEIINALEDQNKNLKQQIKSYLCDISQLNQSLEKVNKQLFRERQMSILNKKSFNKVQSELIVERQSLKLHINKLENALLTQKLQNAERFELNKQIQQSLKKHYQEEIESLRYELQLMAKKKKGFFS